MVTIIALQPSPSVDPLPELEVEGRAAIIVDPDSFTGWTDVFTREPAADDYLIAPGDYRAWGKCRLDRANPADRRG